MASDREMAEMVIKDLTAKALGRCNSVTEPSRAMPIIKTLITTEMLRGQPNIKPDTLHAIGSMLSSLVLHNFNEMVRCLLHDRPEDANSYRFELQDLASLILLAADDPRSLYFPKLPVPYPAAEMPEKKSPKKNGVAG